MCYGQFQYFEKLKNNIVEIIIQLVPEYMEYDFLVFDQVD